MTPNTEGCDDQAGVPVDGKRRVRADAQRNLDLLLEAAKEVFSNSGVDAPVREIAQRAGVGIATLYRHFPQRSDLIEAVFRHEIDACAVTAEKLAADLEPDEALSQWLQRYAEFVAAKRGLAAALHSGNPAFEALPDYFDSQLRPAMRRLVEAARDSGRIRGDIDSEELLTAVTSLCNSPHNNQLQYAKRMVALMFDGLHHGPKSTALS